MFEIRESKWVKGSAELLDDAVIVPKLKTDVHRVADGQALHAKLSSLGVTEGQGLGDPHGYAHSNNGIISWNPLVTVTFSKGSE